MNKIIKEILELRGIVSESEIEEFLSDSPRSTYDPFLLNDMEAGVDLILQAIKDGKKIYIYGDYDADGVTSTCIMYTALRAAGADANYFLPSRFTDGYGLNSDALDRLKADGADVVLTVDCGSVSVNEVAHAHSIGLEVVVTDHHEIDDTAADCILINPHRKDNRYPFTDLAGCGVAYKFVQGLQRKGAFGRDVLIEVLDLVAVGTVADIVPVTDENRSFIKYGFRAIKRAERPGLDELIKCSGVARENMTSQDIGFKIAPLINACGRIDKADIAAELLLSTTREEAKEKVYHVIELNEIRKQLQSETVDRCLDLAGEQCRDCMFPVIFDEEANEGIIGIAASRLKDIFARPVIIVTSAEGGMLKGTGRSTLNVDLFEVLSSQSELFEKFGGHSGACGFSIRRENLDLLRAGLENEMKIRYGEESSAQTDDKRVFDIEIDIADVTSELAYELNSLEPFGRGNEIPVFKISGILPRSARLIGRSGDHFSFTAASWNGGSSFRCVAFGTADEYFDTACSGELCDIYGTIALNEWNGSTEPELLIKHIETERS